jgi:hypothetical protein
MGVRGETVFRGLNSTGINLNGCSATVVGSLEDVDLFRFEDGSGSASCTNAITINTTTDGASGGYILPHLYGEISGNYSVTAQRDAFVTISSSSLVDATGTVSVSADNGSTNVATAADGTRIEGGSPAP